MKRYIKPNTSLHTIVPSKMILASPDLRLNSGGSVSAEQIGTKQRSYDEGTSEKQNEWDDSLW